MRTILRVLVFFSPALLFGQSTKISPDCDIPFTLTAAGQSSSTGGCAQNLQGVVTWEMIYQSDGFSALSILVQQAPDSSGSPGSWATFTAASGSNPNTSTTGLNAQSSYAGQSPWVRVTLSTASGSGTIVGHLYGWRTGSGGGSGGGGGSGCPGTTATPCVVDGVTAAGVAPTTPPVLTAGWDGSYVRTVMTDNFGNLFVTGPTAPGNPYGVNPVNIGTVDQNGNVEYTASDIQGGILAGAASVLSPISLSSSGLTQIVAPSGGHGTRVFHYSIAFASAVNFQLEYGTGPECETGTTALTGVYQSITAIAIDVPFSIPTNQALCANLGSAVTGGGTIEFLQP